MIRCLPIVIAAGILTGCGTTRPEPEVRTVEVLVPQPVTCVPANLPRKPEFSVTSAVLAAAPDAAARLLLAVAGMLERDVRLAQVEPVVAGCR